MMQTARAKISPLQTSDIDEVIMMYHEKDSNKYIAPLLNKSDDYYKDFLAKKISDNKSEVKFWTVRSIENDEFIGTINLNDFMDKGLTHIGCHLALNYWGRGYATELLKPIINYGFTIRKLEFIHAIIHPDNLASIHLFKKLGFNYLKPLELDSSTLDIFKLEK